MRKKVAILITVFPIIEHFLDNFFRSLQQQSYKDFDILVINDGLKNFYDYKKEYDFNIIEYQYQDTPAKNREFGINKAIDLGYDYLIFADVDDYFSTNRIEESIKKLANYDLVYNELTLVDKNGKILVENYIHSKVDLAKFDIFKSNLFGLSNTGIRLNLFETHLKIPLNLIAVDWYIFSVAMLKGNIKYYFLPDAITYYRQYNNNTIGLTNKFDQKNIINSLKVKKIHYQEMVLYCKKNKKNKALEIYKKKLQAVLDLEMKLKDKITLQTYLSIVNTNFENINTGWWSEII